MKTKIITFVISAVLLLSCLSSAVFANGETLQSEVFEITSVHENTSFKMEELELPEVSRNHIDTMFDKFGYDASFYGAYKASLFIDGNEVPFTSDIPVTVSIGEEFSQTDVFVFSIDENTGVPSERVACVQNGTDFTISGEDFSAITGDIIVVMTGVTAPEYTIIPAVICAAVALIAIIVSVMLVKKKLSKEVITD